MSLSAESLTGFLKILGVDTSTWGIGRAKRIEDLLEEIQNRECRLVVDSNGIHRELDVVGFRVSISGQEDRGIIVESARGRRPSGTIKGDESRLDCLRRELAEELAIENGKSNFSFGQREQGVQVSSSPSYPTLPSVYNLWEYDVVLYKGFDHLLHDGEFTIAEKNGGQNTFRWERPIKEN